MSSREDMVGAGDTAQRSGAQSNTPDYLSHDNTVHHTTPVPGEIFLATTWGRIVHVSPGKTVLLARGEYIDYWGHSLGTTSSVILEEP